MATWKPQVKYKKKRIRGSDETVVIISQQIPGAPSRGQWLITTERMRLSSKAFTHTDKVNKAFSEGRGRAIACVDQPTMTTHAAVRYHIDPESAIGIKLLEISLPKDVTNIDAAYGATRILKKYLHRISRDLRFGETIRYAPNTDEEQRNATGRLRFRRAGVAGRQPYFEQPDV